MLTALCRFSSLRPIAGRCLWLGLRQLAASSLFPKGDVFFYLDAHWYSDLPSAEKISAILRVNKVLTRRAIIASPEMENLAAVGIPSDAQIWSWPVS